MVLGQKPHWTEHPDVASMIRLAIRRKGYYFDKRNDIDDATLFADLWGECFKSKYDPTKRKPGSHAYQVACSRIVDLARRGNLRVNSAVQTKTDDGAETERIGAVQTKPSIEEMERIAENAYRTAKGYLESTNIPLRPKFLAFSCLDRAQRVALHCLQQTMGWSTRQARDAIGENPGILRAIGVVRPLSHQFFHRLPRSVTHLQKAIG